MPQQLTYSASTRGPSPLKKRLLPVIALGFFIAAEAFLKGSLIRTKYFSAIWPDVFLLAGFTGAVAMMIVLREVVKRGSVEEFWNSLSAPSQQKWQTWALLIILSAGVFVRVWHLGNLADGMTYDEAYKGLDAIAIREFHERPVFLDWNGGREALVAYLVAVNQKLFDYSIISVRLISALCGCLTLLFFFLFVKTIFNRNAALLATFLMAVSKYHIIHSRYGVRAGQFTVYEVAVLYFVARGMTSSKKFPWSYIIAGAIAGLGFYTYIAFRVFPMILLCFLLEKVNREKIRKHAAALACGCALACLIFAPAAIYYIKHHQAFTERMQKTAAWNENGHAQHPVQALMLSSAKTLGIFTYQGDAIARHNVGLEPMLSPFASAFFLFGLALTLVQRRKPYARFLILYLLLGLLPGMLSVGAPNAPRDLGAIPPAMLLIAFGIIAALRLVSDAASRAAKPVLIIILSGIFFTGIYDAMIRFPEKLDTIPRKVSELWGMDRDQTNIAILLNQLGPQCVVYLSPQLYFHSTVEYLTYEKSQHRLLTLTTNFKREALDDHVVMVVLQPAMMNLWWLRDDNNKLFYKWWVQVYGFNTTWIRRKMAETYDSYLMNTSDRRVLYSLQAKWPNGHLVNLDRMTLFIFKVQSEKP